MWRDGRGRRLPEAYVRQQASADHVPGAAVGIVEGCRPVLLSGFGDASASTSFFLGSLSKSFTALAVMQRLIIAPLARGSCA
jgi:CubicO group peptidase (beta-lactamase class C family)